MSNYILRRTTIASGIESFDVFASKNEKEFYMTPVAKIDITSKTSIEILRFVADYLENQIKEKELELKKEVDSSL